MRFSKAIFLLTILAASSSAQFLPDVRLSPTRIKVGSGDTAITVSGINFKPSFQVYWNGAPLSTKFVSAGTLKAALPSADVTQPGLAQISLYDSDTGTAASNPDPFLIYLPLNSTDLAWDATRGRIYAALTQADPNGPAIAVIDPDKGIVERYIVLPGDPTTLAVSAGARFLYIGMKDRVHRIDLTGAQSDVDLLFAGLPQNASTSPATSILPLPGDGTSYVVVLGTGGYSAFAVDGVVPRPNHSNDAPRCLVAVDGTSLYGGPGFYQLSLDASGMPYTAAVADGNLAAGTFCPAFANGRMYGSNGDIVDPTIPARVGRLPAYGLVDVAPEINRVYFFGFVSAPGANTGSAALMVFDATSHALLQTVALPVGLSSNVGRLIHWGTGGVAFGDYSQANTNVSDGIYLLHVPASN